MNNANSKYQFLYNLDLDQDVVSRISLLLDRTLEGSNEVYVTPMAKEHGPEELLLKFDKVFNLNKSKLNDTLLDLENSNRDKFGPRSIAIPWSQRDKSLNVSFESIDDIGKDSLESLRGLPRLRPLSIDKSLMLLKNSTNSGLPYFTRKGKVKERVLDKYDTLLKRKDPCILFTRTQEQSKTRSVWGYPMADTLNEMRYYSPLLAYQKGLPYRSAVISPDKVSSSITDLINKSSLSKRVLYSIDFAAYDTSVKSKLQTLAFDYIKSLFQAKCAPDIDYIADRFRSIGIITPYGVLKGNHGVPSGSTFTNEVDSIVQATIGMSLPFVQQDSFQVQGDDGVYLVPLGSVDELRDKFTSFGLSVNSDKSYVSDNFAIYLQNLFHKDYVKNGIIGGIYPVYRALNRILYQERWSDFEDYGIKGKDFYSIRTICIVENCKHHPLFRELVKFVKEYDKYSLDFSYQSVSDYVQMISDTDGAGEFLKHQYGDDVKGIKSFETFKMLKEMS